MGELDGQKILIVESDQGFLNLEIMVKRHGGEAVWAEWVPEEWDYLLAVQGITLALFYPANIETEHKAILDASSGPLKDKIVTFSTDRPDEQSFFKILEKAGIPLVNRTPKIGESGIKVYEEAIKKLSELVKK
jgi:hypothetical protein